MTLFRKIGRQYWIWLFLTGWISSTQAQSYDSVLQVLDTRYPQEKLYLHFDRSFYNPGETIWFKMYLLSANMPSQISKTVYAELFDDKGKLIERKVSPVVMSSGAAAFDLPDSLSASHVEIRAYTEWMLNFDTAFLYHKTIPVIQPEPAEKKSSVKNILEFFPEGGDLVQGIESRVAFKGTNSHGLPFEVSGQIIDSKNAVVAAFSSDHDGMGIFRLKPEAGQTYRARWKDSGGKQQSTPLPSAKKQGYVLALAQDRSGIRFEIKRSDNLNAASLPVTIVGQMQQQLVYMANANMAGKPSITGIIPTPDIPAGILQLTLFSGDQQPEAERIIFVNKQDYYFITDINNPLKGFGKRARNVIQIDVPDTIKTNLSLSITDADLHPPLKGEGDIFSHILLSSDLKGYIHQPGYYFSSEADSVARHLDLVMMTNGWRRFNWKKVLAGNFPEIKHLPADYLTIHGKVNGLTRTQLVQQELTGILEINRKQEFLSIPVNPDGKFTVPGLIFFDTARLYYQFNKDKDKVLTTRASFDLQNNLLNSPRYRKSDTASVYQMLLPPAKVLLDNQSLAEKNAAVLDARRKVQMLEAVTVTARQKSKKQEFDENYTSGLFSGGDGYTFIMEDDISANAAISVLNYLQGKVAGLQIAGMGPQATMSWRGGTPSLFLNEMLTDVGMVQNISMADVAMIKVFRPPFYGAPGGGSGGAIAVYTKKGVPSNSSNVKGLDFAKIPGYSEAKEFYSPDYSKYDERHTDADYRPTLYWNPYIFTDKDNRRILFTFYNNDVTRRFRVVVEGFDEAGKLTRMEKILQ